jgi:glycine betaine/choline ABC-type transport system substrate-binding protein
MKENTARLSAGLTPRVQKRRIDLTPGRWHRRPYLLLLVLLILVAAALAGCGEKGPDIKVGGKQFSEQFIMAEMFKILIEDQTDLTVEVTTGLTPKVIDDAIKNTEDVDLYLEYTGTGLINLGMELSSDATEVYDTVAGIYEEQFKIKWMQPYGFNNTYAMVVTRETAERLNLKTITDLAAVADQLVLGCTHTFTERGDGYPGLKEHYDFEFKDVKGMDAAIMYQAAVSGDVDVISAFATDGRISAFDLVILEDDKKFFPPYEATAIVKMSLLEAHPELEAVLNLLAGRISDEKMALMNAAVDLDKKEPAEVAREFLVQEGLISQ